MDIVLFGKPGAGKGTQAPRIAAALDVPTVATGDVLRGAVRAGTPMGLAAKAYMDRGDLVPDEVIVAAIAERIDSTEAADGFILDGFPRTTAQADELEKLLAGINKPLEKVVQLDVASALIVERTTLRRTDKRTGQIYHLKYSPPPPDAELEHRADDREETVKQRLEQYEAMTAALLPYYQQRGLLVRVDGVGEPKEITARVLGALGL